MVVLTTDEARVIALAMPEATESDHHGRASFRVSGRISRGTRVKWRRGATPPPFADRPGAAVVCRASAGGCTDRRDDRYAGSGRYVADGRARSTRRQPRRGLPRADGNVVRICSFTQGANDSGTSTVRFPQQVADTGYSPVAACQRSASDYRQP